MEKKPFVTKEQLEEIAKTYPTPFYPVSYTHLTLPTICSV